MTYAIYKTAKNEIQTNVDALSKELNSFPKSDNGMVVESVRVSGEYKILKAKYGVEFKKLRNINEFMAKNFKKEMKQERLNKWKSK